MARNDRIPKGWSRQVFTADEAKAQARAKELRASGKYGSVRVVRNLTQTLSGKGYAEYIVITQKKGE